ncbi:MAG TPA: aldehyde dehydrogenase, partial [Actinomycetota bacterium]|nr:aldehyde dehydrogenase [Actinomycetota bacterium]
MRAIRSLVGGEPLDGAPGGAFTISNPARLDDRVATASLGDGETFLDACRRAKAAQPRWAEVPSPVRGRAI